MPGKGKKKKKSCLSKDYFDTRQNGSKMLASLFW